jgi:transcriptional regulator with XRE-family HTH domain
MVSKIYKKIPNSLRKYRRIQKLSQKEVAHFLSLKSTGRISLWENGECLPSLVNAIRLATLYRTMVDGLFGDLMKTLRDEVIEKEHKVSEEKSSNP